MPTEYDLNVPSLDGQSVEELCVLRDVFSLLARYADLKSRAMAQRKVGQIDTALNLEAYADRVYEQLPQWARW